MKKIHYLLFLLLSTSMFSQEKLSLETCYSLLNKNYPLAKQSDILAKQNELDLAAISNIKLPTLELGAQTTYQSDVTQMPISIPNTTVESPNKDQYKATLSVNQLIYKGGFIDATAKVSQASLKTQQKQVEVTLYQLKKQVNTYFFLVVLFNEKMELLRAKKTMLEAKLNEVKAGIKFGALLPTSDYVIEAEVLKIKQQLEALSLNKSSLIKSLAQLIGTPISTHTEFENPTITTDFNTDLERPELALFQLQKEQIETSEKLLSKQNSPNIIGFATGGYGNPGLNMLDNSFQTFYQVGVKLNWNIFDWNANKKQRESLLINKEIVENQEAVFQLNTAIELQQKQTEINKLSNLINSDLKIIELRKKILKSAESQLKNGVITSAAYITEVTNLFEAENNLQTHKIEMLLEKANYNTIKGN
ncbi:MULTISPECIES: TolC family protein [Flavobacteriaceae]|uniref:TolC family protein n=2 Tax=Flavobacteriaceae TaxID=49546 RepID=A0A4Y8AST8_9FLAO|nr:MULTISPECIES: TolC family protein [Flavobacteriaceae]TEW73738.1 TolC family protein [Gramella jeungdoensis]